MQEDPRSSQLHPSLRGWRLVNLAANFSLRQSKSASIHPKTVTRLQGGVAWRPNRYLQSPPLADGEQARARGHRPGLLPRSVPPPWSNPGAKLKSISHRCYLFEVAFVWGLTEKTIDLFLGCLQGRWRTGSGTRSSSLTSSSVRVL